MTFDYFDIKIQAERLNKMQKELDNLKRTSQVSRTSTPTVGAPSGDITLDDITDLDTLQYMALDGTKAMEADMDLDSNDLLNVNSIHFDIAPTATLVEGDLSWNATDKTLNVKTDTDTTIQVGQEMVLRVYNNSGVTLSNGQVVYIDGATSDRPTVSLANANKWETSQKTIGIVTADILDTEEGFVTVFGLVRDLDTNGMSAGDTIWLDTTDGGFVNSAPSAPNFLIEVGTILTVHLTEGIVFFNLKARENLGFYNGTFVEGFDAFVVSDGVTVTLELERGNGGGDLTMRFNDAYTTLDCTPKQSIALTAGTATVPQFNYIYIPQSTKVLTVSTSGFPTAEEHIRVADVYIQTAALVNTDGTLLNRNWNDHNADVNNQGHLAHIGEWIRQQNATYVSGLGGNGTSDYVDIAVGDVRFKMEGGIGYQLHRHVIPAKDTTVTGGDDIHVMNDSITPFKQITNLFDITLDSTGTAIGTNKYFNLIFIVALNKTGEHEPLGVKLPSGSYTSLTDAQNDVLGYDDFSLPVSFKTNALMICRLTFQMKATWVYHSTTDLRGSTPSTATGGGSGAAVTSFADNLFDVHDEGDDTKKMVFELSGVTTANTRTVTIQDASGIMAYSADIATHAAIVDAHHSRYTDAEASGVAVQVATSHR